MILPGFGIFCRLFSRGPDRGMRTALLLLCGVLVLAEHAPHHDAEKHHDKESHEKEKVVDSDKHHDKDHHHEHKNAPIVNVSVFTSFPLTVDSPPSPATASPPATSSVMVEDGSNTVASTNTTTVKDPDALEDFVEVRCRRARSRWRARSDA